jgi:eukaryotic-like serine/threonine-protein kinase
MNTLGRYRIERKLGEGGMGIVYAAHDERLDRAVAIKRIRPGGQTHERERLWREARAAASVSHPNICQLYEIAEDGDELFLAMELLDGEPLSARLERGPLPPNESAQVALSVLSALAALHDKGILHRDLKPSNIFLSRHGVKLLDFGLARAFEGALTHGQTLLTQPGLLIGTPRYMAPEQLEGRPVDRRVDLFALGIVLYEMVAGQPPFAGQSVFDVARAILHDEPPALCGSSGIVALDRIINRALRKQPDARYQTASVFAQDLRAALLVTDSAEGAPVRPMTRLVVLPFRLLRPDPGIDFLSFSLADAISSAISGLPSLVVRSTAAAAAFSTGAPDLAALARALDVDTVLLGTLLSSGEEVRVSAQLVQAPSGTLLRSITSQAAIGEIFQLQDRLSQTIVESLSLSLSPRDQNRINRDAPASPEAYEWYLRANEMQLDSKQWTAARDLYRRCVERDPQFAPAWARLGRCYRLLGKFGDRETAAANLASGELALKKALAINPDLSVAHNLYAHVEVEAGRAREAMVRLLDRVRVTASEPDLFAGLVHACRYCGLLDASEAAYERARSLDPHVVTSVAQTYLQQQNWDRAIATDLSHPPIARLLALIFGGRRDEGVELLRTTVAKGLPPALHALLDGLRAFLEGQHEALTRNIYGMLDSGFGDPEAFYHWAAALALAGDQDGALGLLERSMNGGFNPASALLTDARFDTLRSLADFRSIARRADELQRESLDSFRAADGPRLLGLPPIQAPR